MVDSLIDTLRVDRIHSMFNLAQITTIGLLAYLISIVSWRIPHINQMVLIVVVMGLWFGVGIKKGYKGFSPKELVRAL